MLAIKSDRLLIRPITMLDAEALTISKKRSIESLKPFMEWATEASLEHQVSIDVINMYQPKYQKFCDILDKKIPEEKIDTVMFVACLKENPKEIIVYTGYNEIDYADSSLEIGYWCDSKFQRQGYTTEVTKALCRYAFDELKFSTVRVRINGDNKNSEAVALKTGFKKVGEEQASKFFKNPINYIYELKQISSQ